MCVKRLDLGCGSGERALHIIRKGPLSLWGPGVVWRPPPGVLSERLLPDQLNYWKAVQEHIARYVFASQFTEGKVVLDIACGCGYGSAYLLSQGAERVVGADISELAIRAARRWLGSRQGLQLVVLDAGRIPFAPRSFDMVVSFETIEHLPDPDKFLRGIRSILRPGGSFLCSTPTAQAGPISGTPVSSYHSHEFTASEFRSLVGQHFTIAATYGQHLMGQQPLPLSLFRLWQWPKGLLCRLGRPGLAARLGMSLAFFYQFVQPDSRPVRLRDIPVESYQEIARRFYPVAGDLDRPAHGITTIILARREGRSDG